MAAKWPQRKELAQIYPIPWPFLCPPHAPLQVSLGFVRPFCHPELISDWTALKPSRGLVWETHEWQTLSTVSLNGAGGQGPINPLTGFLSILLTLEQIPALAVLPSLVSS